MTRQHTYSFSILSLLAQRLLSACAVVCLLAACTMEPPLHLVDPQKQMSTDFSKIVVDMDVLWDYELEYDWQSEWIYGWDEIDDEMYGKWDIVEPKVFNIRRYFTGEDPRAAHSSVLSDIVEGKTFKASYKFGYYDLLVWNDVETIDGVQSLHYDESTTLEYVTAYTNQSMMRTNAPSRIQVQNPHYAPGLAFYQPEFLFAGYYEDLHVTDNPDDYDYVLDDVWYKHIPLVLTPVTYIYLPQIILHHNRGKIAQIDGTGNLTGMASAVNMNTHVTSHEDISVNHTLRMKTNVDYTRDGRNEKVDIIGGRAMTFGLTGCDPYNITRADGSYEKHVASSKVRNYLEVNMIFNNGKDSTLVFDVTDQVKEHYKGGVLTIHLDCDTITVPARKGGSGFDAVVMDSEEVTYEFDM